MGERPDGDKEKRNARGTIRGASALLGRVFFMKGFEGRATREEEWEGRQDGGRQTAPRACP